MRVKFMTLVLSLVLLFGTVITVDAAGLKTVAVSVGQTTAENAAKQYLKVMPFSRQGLIEQLSSQYGSGFSEDESVAAVDKLEQEELVDWNEQAVRYARRYLEMMPFSRQGLLKQLSSEFGSQFTDEQAETAVAYLESTKEADWNQEATEAAESYLKIFDFSRRELLDQLTSVYGSGFTPEQAEYALNAVGY